MPEFLSPQRPQQQAPVKTADAKAKLADIGRGFKEVGSEIAGEPQRLWSKFWYKIENLPLTNFQMAEQFIREGKITDAVFRLKVTLWLAPNHVQSWYLLGSCYDRLGKREKALEALTRAMTLAPNHPQTLFLISTIDPTLLPANKRPQSVPKEMIIEFFEKLAPTYEEFQRENNYAGHTLLANAVKERLDSRKIDYAILDLGCGTGLVGSLIADSTARLIGVDITKGMADIAGSKRRQDERRAYSQIIQQDMRAFLLNYKAEPFDIVTAAHCFNYVGELSSIMQGVSNLLQPGGWFIFQVEPYKQEGFGLISGKGRFGHSEEYVQQQLANYGFEILNYSMVPVFPNYSLWQYIARKS
ncbi:MAG: methyltransferase domain-containing protein [Rickettsiales bacterium]